MPNAINLPDIAHCGPHAHGFFEDFDHIISLDRWTKVIDTGGTALVGDAVGGVVSLTGDGTDEDGTNIATTAELFLVADGKPLMAEARLRFTEAATDEANVFFGVSDLDTVDVMVDAGAGPAVSFDGALFYKSATEGNQNWGVISSNATAQTKTITDQAGAMATGVWHTLRILITPITSTIAEVTFWIDPAGGVDLVQCRENGANPRTPSIKHTLTITGLAEMHVVAGVKNGSAVAETLQIDYIQAWQKR